MIKLQAVEQRKLYVQIADQLRDLIHSGDVKPGQQLPAERELAQSLGVSRPTVREALIALEVVGLVEVKVGIGAFVRSPVRETPPLPENHPSPTEVMELRLLLEPRAAALAAQNIDPELKAKLRLNLDFVKENAGKEHWNPSNDREFHLIIAEATGNSAMFEILEQIWEMRSKQIDLKFHQHLGELSEVRSKLIEHHDAIGQAIIDGDDATAFDGMMQHLNYVSNAMRNGWEQLV
ncbi:FadR/GntR family transcriptional regulator [Herbaspirillum sp. NPDC087042]|uniref:FadR/GntR family transcriptional regulator n=1 Tax=Herbaspirillum sp. NPDC087042 TaxID=3364004 RepID=UPI00381721FF